MAVAPLKAPISGTDLPTGSDVFGPLPAILAAVGSGGARARHHRRRGPVALAGGAADASARAGRGLAAHPTRLAVGNVLIAAGTLILGASGTLNGGSARRRRSPSRLTIGITVLFAGFLVATSVASAPGGPTRGAVGPSASAQRAAEDLASPALG